MKIIDIDEFNRKYFNNEDIFDERIMMEILKYSEKLMNVINEKIENKDE